MNRVFPVLASLMVALAATGAGCADELRTGDVSVEHVRFFELHGRLPTYLAHLLGREVDGFDLHLADEIRIANRGDHKQLATIELELPGYSSVTRQSVVLPPRSTTHVPSMTPNLDFEALYNIRSEVPVTIELRVLVDGALVEVVTQQTLVRSLNRVSWHGVLPDRENHDLRSWAAAVITPNDPEVHALLREAAAFTQRGAMTGYQSQRVGWTQEQLAAVFYALQSRGHVYTSVAGGHFFDGPAQSVRLPAETLQTGSGNCVEGTFLVASALEAVGIQSALVYVRGHVLVAARALPDSDEWFFLETTIIGDGVTFEEARDAGWRRWESALSADDPDALWVEVRDMRERGVVPVAIPGARH